MMRIPATVIVDLTSSCNLRCRYCCFFSNPNESAINDLGTGAWVDFIRDAGRCGVMNLVLRGGEALLRDDLDVLIKAIVDNRMRFSILTNGKLMTPGIAKLLADSRRCDFVKISLDGRESEHDFARGSGSHAAAIRAIAEVRRAGLPTMVTCAVHKLNYRTIPDLGTYFFDELDLPQVTFSAVTECEAGDMWCMNQDEFDAMTGMVAELKSQYPDRLPERGVAAVIARWHRILAAEKSGRPIASGCGFCGCSTSQSLLRVCADGRYMLCTFKAADLPYTIADTSIAEVWRLTESYRNNLCSGQVDSAQVSGCRNCRFSRSCHGVCPGDANYLTPQRSFGCLARYLNSTGRLTV